MTVFNPTITQQGLAAVFNAEATGTEMVLTHMAYGTAAYDPIGDETALQAEVKRVAIGGGQHIADNQIRISSIWESDTDRADISEIGFYADSILFAVISRSTGGPFLYKTPGSNLIFSYDWVLNLIPVGSITFLVDPDAMALLGHMNDPNAHAQYLTIAEFQQRSSKNSVRLATTADLPSLSGLLVVDGVNTVVGDRVLVKNQNSAFMNGIYVVASGAWYRAADADSNAKTASGYSVPVEEGVANFDSIWQLTTNNPIALGTTNLVFEVVSGPSGVEPGTYTQVTVDSRGRTTHGENPTTLDGYGITDALPIDGTAVAATKLETERTVSVSGAATGSATFDGTDDADIAITLADSGVAAGTYSTVTVDAKGLVTGGDQLTGDDLGLGTAAYLDAQIDLHDVTPNALMKVGAFGWGGPAYAVSDVDIGGLNAETALYFISNGIGGPGGGIYEGWVRVSAITPGQYAFQEIYGNADHTLHRRALTAGVWGEWESTWDTRNLVKQTYPQDDTPGHVLLTGAYGIGHGGIVLPDGTDLNTITTVGIYRVNTSPNMPAGGQFSPMLVAVSQDTLWQQIIGYNSGITYSRGGLLTPDGYVFSDWATSWNTNNFNPAEYQHALGFTPVQEGGGVGQDGNKIYIGYNNASGQIKIQVDAQDFGHLWTQSNFDPDSIFSMPVGVPFPWPTATPPARCFVMAGQPFDVAGFPALAGVYPNGIVPDMRGEWVRGCDNGRGIDPGRAMLSPQTDAMQQITGGYNMASNTGVGTGAYGAFVGVAGSVAYGEGGIITGDISMILDTTRVVRNAHETRPRSVAFNYICRAH